jgi:hypothetical protein
MARRRHISPESKALPSQAWLNTSYIVPAFGVFGKCPIWTLCLLWG